MLHKPRHIAISIEGNVRYAKEKNIPLSTVLELSKERILDIVTMQIQENIPILSFFLFPQQYKEFTQFEEIVNAYDTGFATLVSDPLIIQNQVKISFIGKWYSLPGRLVERIKKVIDETKDYDRFFLNFYINYDGQEEILDALKLLIRKAETGKIMPEFLSKEDIKDSLYSSFFLPPDMIIRNGTERSTGGILLWDSSQTYLYSTNKYWPEFTIDDWHLAIKAYQQA